MPPEKRGDFKFDWQHRFICDPTLTHTMHRIGMFLHYFADADGGRILPGAERVAVDLKMHINTVRNNLKKLEQLGWIAVVDRGGKGGKRTTYQLTIPARHLLP